MKTLIHKMLSTWAVAGLSLAGLVSQSLAAGGSYTIDFAAARPSSYAKQYPIFRACPSLINGTANNPIVGARFLDSVESLEPQDMALGQIVVYEVLINVNGSVSPEGGKATFTMGWSTETTSGAPFGYDEAYGVYCAFIDTGDEAHVDPLGNAAVDNTSWVWINEKNPSKSPDEIVGTFDLSGLDDGDTVVLEIWMVLDKTFVNGATGNIQSRLISARTASGDTINTGNQTVPLMKVDDFASLCSLGDWLWLDTDRDGIQDLGEVGKAGFTVVLYAVPPSGPVVPVATNITDQTGHYLFSGLVAGNYQVRFIIPPPDPSREYVISPRYAGTDPALDSNIDTSGWTEVITLSAGEQNPTIDAGIWEKTTLAVVVSFEALVREDGQVAVQWQTSMEKDTLGYYVERREASGAYTRINARLEPAKIMVSGLRTYQLVDAGAVAGGTYTYRLVEVETTGRINTYGPYEVSVGGGTADGASEPAVEEAAVPVISALTAGSGHMVLRWSSAAGQSFRLERSADLKSFETVAAGIPATPPENVTVVVDGAQAGFYRVAVE